MARLFGRKETMAREPTFLLVCLAMVAKTAFAALLMGIPISFSGLSTSAGLTLVLISFACLIPPRKQKLYLLPLDMILSLVLVVDCVYFRYFHSPTTIYTLMQGANLQGLGDSILSLLSPVYIVFFLDFPLLLFTAHKGKGLHRSRKTFGIVFFGGIMISSLFPLTVLSTGQKPFRRLDVYLTFYFYGPIGYHVLDTACYFQNLREEMTEEERADLDGWFDRNGREKGKKCEEKSEQFSAAGRNLIVIQVESLQAFVVGKKIDGQEITPNLDALLKHSLYFPRIYPQTVEGNSSDAELIVNTSLYPVFRGSAFFRFPDNRYPSLAFLLNRMGYYSFAIHGDEKTYWNRELAYPGLGFEEYTGIEGFVVDEEIGMGMSDEAMFRQALPMLESARRPFYAFIITLTSHKPFTLPPKYHGLKLPSSWDGSLLANYLQSIHYVDKAIGNFIRGLAKGELLESSLVVIYGDHDGILFGDRATLVEWAGKEIDEEEWLRQFCPIPLIIFSPAFEGRTFETIGGHIDIMPTIANLMGLDTAKWGRNAMGRNLLSENRGDWGSAILPRGDYSHSELLITKYGIGQGLSESDREMLRISDLAIRRGYFGKESSR